MARPRRKDRTEPDGRQLKITLGDLRSTGVRDLIVFCQDYRCSHIIKLPAAYVDQWPDGIRISQLEPQFVCISCGMRGSNIVAGSNSTEKAILPRPVN
ncbi:hypothetical protein L6654_41420 [Bradyrhizobium sp. WYCCWR 13023]|uniref:Uncharacterized protein n=1 Tax=Bradyrhizobium zhengyangense TaxID=2911009 RepID=A0A9X1RLV9_9BRAD|nr:MULTISPECIES: hypothetical protein [Bradyrhizobium]MCG2633024.1 hypothetical protein [Bradyrhizobium zhengyangense]MCG2673222.1 hypothetical protein [Bradyrhizobium zhengyangense]MDA9520136.1 hypothetical protein [Bradyrhizobium sp. CCBAU 11434]